MYDVLGKEVEILFSGNQSDGVHRFEWDPRNGAKGVYFVHLQFNDALKTHKVILAQ